MERLQYRDTMPRGNRQLTCRKALPCLGVVGTATAVTHCHTAWRQWVVELLRCTATLLLRSRHSNPYNAPSRCRGGYEKVELLECSATLLWGIG